MKINRVNLLLSICVTCLFTLLSACSTSALTRQEIVRIAGEQAKGEGIILANRNTVFDRGNKRWHRKFKTINTTMAPSYEFLENREYQAILYSLKRSQLGGDFWVFVDKQSGEVLTFYGEE